MANSVNDAGTSYSIPVGALFVFNLIVGTGALTMPKAFSSAGWALSIVFITLLSFMSYVSVTYIIEVMATSNAAKRLTSLDNSADDGPEEDENRPLLDASTGNLIKESVSFEITERMEMGQMVQYFLPKVGIYFFYGSIIIYLYGDLAIYAAAVPKSMRDVFCTFARYGNNSTNCGNESLTDDDLCWHGTSITRLNGYRIFVAIFTCCIGPFLFFEVQKTKYLQLLTSALRWLAFSLMIAISLTRIAKGKGEGKPQTAEISGIPVLFGVCVYSFMCHHSLPSLVTPIRNKSWIHRLIGLDYLIILSFYLLLSLTGIFSFRNIQDLYTLNFQPGSCSKEGNRISFMKILDYFLALFPVFTLSTNFPIIGITLRNNLKTLFLHSGRQYSFFLNRIIFPTVTLLPPIAIAMITSNLEILVGITGSYAGSFIQYIIPVCLVYYSRKYINGSTLYLAENPYSSPFKHNFWVVLTVFWAVTCISLVTVNHVLNGFT